MPVWKVTPKRWYSWDFAVLDERGQEIGEVKLSPLWSSGTVIAGGLEYAVSRDRTIGVGFSLEGAGTPTARAVGRKALWHGVTIIWNERSYQLVARSPWRRGLVLWEGAEKVGLVAPERAFSRKSRAELPAILPPVVGLFVVWLAEMLWKRTYQKAF